ncbi:MAG: hypothetical protein OHK0046_21580 [Anaerolineae bacterium]
MEASLIYTCNIRGNLHLLPRMFTFIQSLREGKPLLLDLGHSCDPEVWPCGITQGRAALYVLDAMGYTAANVQGVLTAESRAKLLDNVALALVNDAHPHTHGALTFTTHPQQQPTPQIILTPAESTHLENNVLRLAGVAQGELGVVRVENGEIVAQSIHPLPAKTLPDATITGAVDFVEAEARYYEKRRHNPE